jgi:hypothetical protein
MVLAYLMMGWTRAVQSNPGHPILLLMWIPMLAVNKTSLDNANPL